MANSVVFSDAPEDFYYTDINIPCQAACPAFTNIPAYIRALYEEQPGLSYDINQAANILPGVLGRICSRPCEDLCRHGEAELGSPVNICHIKRAAADFTRDGKAASLAPAKPLGRKVAVIGAGPAGLAAAHDLAQIGIGVTIYEAFDHPGGMLRYGIPEFRLPRSILKEEIDAILNLGVTLKTGVRIGDDLPMESLLDEHDGVLIATGCYRSVKLNVPGESLPGVYPGLEFMIDFCSDQAPQVGKTVLVIGAGFTAFDCARSALRLGAEDVRICLRRTEEDLTVTADEVLETKREGIRIESLMLSTKMMGREKVEAVEFVRTRPTTLRSDGKREIAPIAGSEFVLPADTVLVATGQTAGPLSSPGEADDQGIVSADPTSYRTSVPGLYVTGDYMTGPSTVIESIAMGRWAAERIASDMTRKPFRESIIRMEDCQITDRKRAWDFIPRQAMPTLSPIEKRFEQRNIEVETGYTAELAAEESKRCYLCYLHYEIDLNRCIYCRYWIDVAPRDCIKLVKKLQTNEAGAITGLVETTKWKQVNAIVIDNSRCIRCGECVRICPVDCISVTRVERTERLLNNGDGHV